MPSPGRHRTIDRDKVLDAAEDLVRNRGPAALTIDAVAKANGITKGGVQSCFGTKDGLIVAMFERWKREFDADVTAAAGPDPDPATLVRAYLEVSGRDADQTSWERSSVMMAVLVQMPRMMDRFRDEYRYLLDGLDMSAAVGRRLALALAASDGAFVLRSFGFVQFRDEQWRAIQAEIAALAGFETSETEES